ncbi:hypothetical protein SAMN05216474_0955 [Lishizhenia tianjinensis]|uniref:Uncharacterized protein n=1 Tax=Lishizhenia tianjinensis TaxID=477690 RepID=A0A1I6YJQ0_9FLAO|nr:hypothetical protein [Lishizhenia tianjinensis]SFT50726.1 hypothetical protein SAMN05216474_0955 [Lishizhenia tianjinensis]
MEKISHFYSIERENEQNQRKIRAKHKILSSLTLTVVERLKQLCMIIFLAFLVMVMVISRVVKYVEKLQEAKESQA